MLSRSQQHLTLPTACGAGLLAPSEEATGAASDIRVTTVIRTRDLVVDLVFMVDSFIGWCEPIVHRSTKEILKQHYAPQ